MIKLIIISVLLYSCGQDSLVNCNSSNNKISNCINPDDDTKAMIYLNSKKYEQALLILKPLVKSEPQNYFRYPRLAATYSGLAGFEITNLTDILNSTSQEATPSAYLKQLMPKADPNNSNKYKMYLNYIKQARDVIFSMPEEERTNNIRTYSKSAESQLILYQNIYSMMLINQFTVYKSNDTLDLEHLNSISEEEAESILLSLEESVSIAKDNDNLSQSIQSTLDSIKTQNGENNRAKIISYIETQ